MIRCFFLLLILFSSCSHQNDDPIVAQLHMRNMQTRVYVNNSTKVVVKEILNLLQDEGYIVKNVNMELGLVSAERNVDIEKFSSKFWAYVFSGKNATWKKYSILEMTTNISEHQNQSKVRVNFLLKIYDNHGRQLEVHPINDEIHYQKFFSRLQRGLLNQSPVSVK